MNIKKKFDSIDQSQLSDSQKGILSKIKEATKNFTITDEKSIEKVDGALDSIIAKLQKTNPQAIKGEVKEVEPKKEEPKKSTKSRTKTPKEPKKEVNGKRTIFSIAKEIRKADESWEDAKKRAKKIMEGEKEETTKKMKTETDKLLAFIKRRKELDGLSGTSIKKDSKIEAKPKGRRISKNGKRYYEYRDNRTDRLAPNFEDKIYLADGGYAGGGYVVIAKSEKGGGFVMSKPTSKAKAEKLKSLLPKIDGESNEVMTLNKASKLSGLVGKEYLKYADGGNVIDAFQMRTVRGVDSQPTEVLTNEQKVEFADGGTIIGTPETPLARGLDIDYTGLVGETGGMSAGEMFAMGGSLGNHGLKQGDQIIKTMSGGVQKVKTKSGDIVYVNLANGYRGVTPPLPFAKGGYTNERRHVNKAQDYEVRYAKNKPNRAGYKGKRSFDDGGEVSFIEYKDSEIMYEPNYKKYYANDVEFNSLQEAKDFLDSGEIDPSIRDAYKRGLFAKGGSIKNEDIKVGEEFWLDNGDVIEIVRLFKENIDEDWVEYKRNGDKKENSVKELRLFINRLNGKKQKSFRERRNEYLEKLGSKEADVWDKIGAESGSQIRNSDKMLKAYAEGVEEMLQKEGVGKGSFDQEDYDFYTDENWHLFNEFLVWNGYYEPEMTKTEKEWREKYYADPKKRNYVANPSVISVSGSSKSKSKSGKYIVKADIKEVKVKTDAGYEYTFKGSDVLNGVNVLEKGSLLKNNATYVAKRNIIHVELKNGERIKPANGYWIKKDAKGELFKLEKKEEYKVMSNQAIFPKRGVGTYWYVENSKGQTINNTTGKPYKGKEMTNYYFLNEEGAKKFAEKLNNSSFEGGGKTKRNVHIVNEGEAFDEKKYKAIYDDYDKDGTSNIDDANPLDKTKKGNVEQVELKETFTKLLKVKADLDSVMYSAIDKLDDKAPEDADIYARTKTPYSILKKLVDKRMLDPEKGLTDMVGTTIAVDNQKELEQVRDEIDGGLLGKILDRDDYYKKPKAGYRAYHYIVEYKGYPIEVQLKTKKMKKLNEVSHEFYKNGSLDAKGLEQVSKTFEMADNGDKKAIKEVDKLLKNKELLASKISTSKTKKEYAGGGKTTFKEKATAIAKKFEGKKVEPKYQKEYGKTYDKAEAKEVGNKIAGSQKAKYDSKIITKKGFASNDYDVIVKLPNGLTTKKDFEGFSKEEVIEWCENRGWKYNNKAEKQGGYILKDYEFFVKTPTLYNTVLPNSKGKTSKSGSTKRGGAMQLAKQIRKDGESWQSALKRANEQMRNK